MSNSAALSFISVHGALVQSITSSNTLSHCLCRLLLILLVEQFGCSLAVDCGGIDGHDQCNMMLVRHLMLKVVLN